jgi:hypothetical protein
MDESALVQLKQQLAPSLLSIEGVSGVGVGDGALLVYLVIDSDQVRDQALKVVRNVHPTVAVQFVLSGSFWRLDTNRT